MREPHQKHWTRKFFKFGTWRPRSSASVAPWSRLGALMCLHRKKPEVAGSLLLDPRPNQTPVDKEYSKTVSWLETDAFEHVPATGEVSCD